MTDQRQDRRCGTCHWLEVPLNKQGKRKRTSRNNEYRCLVPFAIDRPASVIGAPPRVWMMASEGTTCGFWKPIGSAE